MPGIAVVGLGWWGRIIVDLARRRDKLRQKLVFLPRPLPTLTAWGSREVRGRRRAAQRSPESASANCRTSLPATQEATAASKCLKCSDRTCCRKAAASSYSSYSSYR